MNLEGWTFMIGSWIIILTLFAYCMIRTLTSGGSETDKDEDPAGTD